MFFAVTILKLVVSVARIELALLGPKPRVIPFHHTEKILERGARIELALSAWKAEILPLNEPRSCLHILGAGNENRTRNLTLAKLCVTTSTMPALIYLCIATIMAIKCLAPSVGFEPTFSG